MMFGLNMGKLGKGGRNPFLLRRLFALGEQGFVADPAYAASLLQDAAGMTRVTAAGQPVGLRLDTRLGLVRGAEVWTDAAATFVGAASKVSPGVYRVITTDGVLAAVDVAGALTVGKFYAAEFTIDSIAVAGGGVIFDQNGTALLTETTLGKKTLYFFATFAALRIKRASGATDIQVSGVSVREVPGSHATQPTAAARPLYQTGPARLVFDGGDDAHVTTFATALGSNCTVVRSVPGVGTTILTGQTIGTTYTSAVTHSGLIVINRALTTAETLAATRWGNQRAGV